jgi:hypothetical protein
MLSRSLALWTPIVAPPPSIWSDHEAYLLRQHLGAAFGPENVQTLKNLYYMGLEVIEVETDYFLRTSGMKRVKNFAREAGRHPS